MKKTIVVLGAKRTAFGSFGGTLKDMTATDLAVAASQAALQQSGVKAEYIDHVVFGNVVQSSADAIYSPRHIGLKVGVPVDRGALGVNRLCGSGFQAWATAAQMILTDEATTVLAGGTEQMSQVPYVVRGSRWGYRMGHGEFEDLLTSSLTDLYAGAPMAITAENLAEQYKISRQEVDLYALQSQTRTAHAAKEGKFKSEISAVSVKTRKGVINFETDEHPKPETTAEILAGLKPVFKKDGGVVTAGNASGIVDGAAATVISTEEWAMKKGLQPMAKILGWASVGCDPKIMGIGPAYAIRKLLDKLNMKLDQMDLIEVNEAFAAQYLAVEKELKLPRERTNVNGGAIAIGHPLGASGTRIMNHLVYELSRRGARYGLGSACIGGGQGIAVLIERMG